MSPIPQRLLEICPISQCRAAFLCSDWLYSKKADYNEKLFQRSSRRERSTTRTLRPLSGNCFLYCMMKPGCGAIRGEGL